MLFIQKVLVCPFPNTGEFFPEDANANFGTIFQRLKTVPKYANAFFGIDFYRCVWFHVV